ncbi:hypothetical protein ES705_00640 [subsurface metagenome]|nr:hypothetical protein [Clostridia bacterium]
MIDYNEIKNNVSEIISLKTETKNIDFKQDINWDTADNSKKISIIKDVIAMANTQDGGIIFIGIKDSDYSFVGISKDSFESLDQTKINDLLHKYSDPQISCQVFKDTYQGKYYAKIVVSEFTETPIICKKDFNTSSDHILRAGKIYIRTEKATSEEICNSQDMRELLNRATIKKGDDLLNNIEKLIKGKPIKDLSEESKKNYDKEKEEAESFLKKKIGKYLADMGYWQLASHPVDYIGERFKDQSEVKEAIRRSEVNLLGWNFPHTDLKGGDSNFSHGRQSITTWEEFIEGYRAYQSGLFYWQRAFVEDIKEISYEGSRVIDFIRTIRYVTEFFLFLKRYYSSFRNVNINVELYLSNIEDRRINTLNPALDINWHEFFSREKNIVIVKKYDISEIQLKHKEIANNIIRKIFKVFNADDIEESIIDSWQDKIINKNL